MPSVLNLYHTDKKVPSGAVYIGRGHGSSWGNPFEIGKDGTRSEVITKYAEWLESQPDLIERAKQELGGKDLVCFCAPKQCHGDVLIRVVSDQDLEEDSLFKF